MTAGELTAICTAVVAAGGAIGGVIKLLGGQIVKSIDDAKLALNRNTDATLKFVEVSARLEVKLDQAHAATQKTADVVEQIADEISGVHGAGPDPFTARTPPGGYALHRPSTKGGR